MTDTSLQLDKENMPSFGQAPPCIFYGLDSDFFCPISSNLGRPMALKEQGDVLLVYEQGYKVHHLHPLATLWLQLLTSFCKPVH